MILLDTQVFVWLRNKEPRIGRRSLALIHGALRGGNAAVSAISFWEIAMLQQKRKLKLPRDLHSWRRSGAGLGIVEIPVRPKVALRAGQIGQLHGDPADRIILATALDGHDLVTSDRRVLAWPGPLRRINARI